MRLRNCLNLYTVDTVAWVNESIFAAGGEHIPNTWREFAELTGITAIVHLAQGKPSQFEGPEPARFLWLEAIEEAQADFQMRFEAGKFVRECILDGQKILLHCPISRHRTRWVYVAYGLVGGRKLAPVLREAAERPWLSPYHTDEAKWEEFVTWIKKSGSTHRS